MPASAAAAAAALLPSSSAPSAAGMHRSTSVASPRAAPLRRPLGRSRLTRQKRSDSVLTRITNEGSELKLREGNPDDAGVELVELPDGTWAPRVALYEKYVDLGPQYQVPDPEKGPLERRVSVQFLDALFSDEINLEDAAYWCTCPPGGWDIEHKVLLKAKPVDVPKAQQGLRPADEPSAASRRPLLSLKIGEVLDGTVCGMALITGIHVDVGARYNGLLPVKSDYRAWNKGLKGKLRMGDKCRVRVAKIIRAPLCRFPLVLEVVDEPEILDAFVPTDQYTGAFDLRGAPDSNSDLRGGELAEVMDSLTGGAWSGGAGYDVEALPVPTGGARRGSVVAAHERALEAEVADWLEKTGLEAKARARRQQQQQQQRAASPTWRPLSAPSATGEEGEEEEGEAEGASASGWNRGDESASESDGDEPRSSSKSRRRRDEDDEGSFPGMFLEEGVDHSDLDAAVAGLW